MPQDIYNLPQGWEWKPFLEVVSTKGFSVGKVKTKEYGTEGRLPIIDQSKSFIAGYCDSDDGFQGSLPVIVYGDHTNNIKYIDFEFICGADGTKVLSPKQGVNPKYLFYAIHRFGPETQGYRRHFPILKQQQIPLPPVVEQERIVEKLDALFRRIDDASNRLNQILTHSQALFASALDETFSPLTGTSLTKPFGEVVVNHDGKRIPIKASERKTTKGDYPYYGATGIIDYVDDYIFDGERLLISEDGANLVARKYPIAFIAAGKYWVNNHAHIVDAKPELTSNHYLETYFAWVNLDPYITGAAQPKLSQKKLNTIPVPLPPLKEQRRIVEHLDGLNERIQGLEKTTLDRLDHLAALKASLLNAAFRGEL